MDTLHTEDSGAPSRSTNTPAYVRPNSVQVRHYRDLLMADTYQEPDQEQHSLGPESRWDFYADLPTLSFRLHNLEFLHVLAEAYRSTGDLAYARQADVLAHRWLRARGVPDDSPAWHGHPTALRTSVLAHLHAAGFSPDETMREALLLHAEFLADDKHYEGAWNHGLDQNIGLLHASQALREPRFAHLAADRIDAAAASYVDAQGVVSEQATSYASYVHERLDLAAKELLRSGVGVSPALRRRDLIPTFLAWATRPDGVLVQVGDSKIERVANLPGTPLEFPATLGERGAPPPGRSMFYDDGWGFIRSGWGETRPYTDESHLTVRYGTFRRVHGHRDHTSILWYAGGRPVLEDPGFTVYGDAAVREYEQLERSHSVVTLEGAGGFAWDRGTELLHHSTHGIADGEYEVHLVHLGGHPYAGVTRTRSILHVPSLDVILVRDAISAARMVNVHQTWQFGASFTAGIADDGQSATLSDASGTVRVEQHLPVGTAMSRRGQTDPLAGWTATGMGVRSPSPSVRFTRRGQVVGMVTSITTRDDVAVGLGREGLLTISVGAISPDPLISVRYDAKVGFLPVSLAPSSRSRWDHVEG